MCPQKTAMEPSCLYNLWLNQPKLLLLQEKGLYGVFSVKIRIYIQPQIEPTNIFNQYTIEKQQLIQPQVEFVRSKTTMEPSCLYSLWLNQHKLLPLQEKGLYGVFSVKIRIYIQPQIEPTNIFNQYTIEKQQLIQPQVEFVMPKTAIESSCLYNPWLN